MAAWHNADNHKQEEAVLHDQSSTTIYSVGIDEGNDYHRGSRAKTPPFLPPPLRTWSSAQRRKQKRVCLCAAATVVLVVILACAIAIPIALKKEKHTGNSNSNNNLQSLTVACQTTLYPAVCYNSLSNLTSSKNNPQQMVQLSLEAATDSVTRELTTAQSLFVNTGRAKASPQLNAVLQDCVEFIQASLDSLEQTLDGLKSLNFANLDDDLADLETWMSASLTTQMTCLDGFDDLDPTTVNGSVADFVQQGRYTSMLLSNVLAFVSALQSVTNNIPNIPNIPGHRRLLTSNEATATFLKRRLLMVSASSANVVVAQDGSGDYRRIQDALKFAPQNTSASSNSQYVIYIKAGKYIETVTVPKNAKNVVFLGDGVGKTIISGNLSVIGSNVTTSATATLSVQGKNFVGRSFTVENTAGAAKHQAVALRVTGDYAAFEMCEFLGYQDTLYTHTNRQFYVNCTIVGTVDFIFGNAAVVLQSSQILATTGVTGQENTYTASGRTDPNQNTGITFQNCTFDGTASLKNASRGTFLTYLGRPWKNYARTVIMQSVETNVVDPLGWLNWNGVQRNSTVYYGEYRNTGPGSNITHRVPWSTQINQSNALKFTADSFIQGKNWLPQANVTYIPSI